MEPVKDVVKDVETVDEPEDDDDNVKDGECVPHVDGDTERVLRGVTV